MGLGGFLLEEEDGGSTSSVGGILGPVSRCVNFLNIFSQKRSTSNQRNEEKYGELVLFTAGWNLYIWGRGREIHTM